jgi:energy-converting hydrogenase Eha subunit C
MTFGVAIFLGAVGAILRYAVADEVEGVDLRMIGLILMVAAAVGLVIGLIQLSTARRRTVTEVHDVPPRAY